MYVLLRLEFKFKSPSCIFDINYVVLVEFQGIHGVVDGVLAVEFSGAIAMYGSVFGATGVPPVLRFPIRVKLTLFI